MNSNPVFPPTIPIEGATLRALRRTDAQALFEYLSDKAVTLRTSYPEVTATLVEGIIDRAAARWATGELSKWAIARKSDDRLIGTCGFNEWSRAHGWAEIAYDLAREEWGQGLMSQVVAAVIDWTFARTEVHRIHAYVRVDNDRSEKLLERLGFAHEGRLRQYRICRGKPYDYDLFAVLRSDWVADRPGSA